MFLLLQLPYRVSKAICSSGCNLAPTQYKHPCYSMPQSPLRQQIKTKLMLCKPLFIVHGSFFKVILQYKNEVPQLQRWAWHMHNKIV